MESALVDFFKSHQERVNMSGDLIKENASRILDRLYHGHQAFRFSNGWLDAFKARHGIRSFRRFGESGSVDMTVITNALPTIRETLNKFAWKDIYNMDETGLFYRMQVGFDLCQSPLNKPIIFESSVCVSFFKALFPGRRTTPWRPGNLRAASKTGNGSL